MFEDRTERELIFIYVFISVLVTLGLAGFHVLSGWHPYVIIVAANIEFFCLFYILYLPIKVKKAREKQEKEKTKKK